MSDNPSAMPEERQRAFVCDAASRLRLILGMLQIVRDNLPAGSPPVTDLENIVIYLRTLHDEVCREFSTPSKQANPSEGETGESQKTEQPDSPVFLH